MYQFEIRFVECRFEKVFGTEKLSEKISRKDFKPHYGGKPTKGYKRIWGQIQAASKYSEGDILQYLKK